MRIHTLSILFFALVSMQAAASDIKAMPDSVCAIDADSVAHKRKNIVGRVIDYFNNSNNDNEKKKFDISVIGGPHYSSDTKFGVGLVAAGFYRPYLAEDSLSQPSNVSLYGDVCTSGFYMLGLRGDHLFRGDHRRIDYNLYFYSFPRYFWGIGYDQGIDMDNKSKYKEVFVNASVDYLWRGAPHFYLGPAIEMAYSTARHRENPALWNGQRSHVLTLGVGFRAQYDTRDNLTAPARGWLLQFEQRFNPKFLGYRYAYSYSDVRVCFFHHAWHDAILATRFHGKYCYGNVPWDMMATFGGSSVMRGYYEGRFRDKGEMDLTVELRQHIWHRNGVVLWLGVGTVFPRFSSIRFGKLLPNGGIGYRWEFKKLTNVRLDLGFAKGEKAFIFSINEAF